MYDLCVTWIYQHFDIYIYLGTLCSIVVPILATDSLHLLPNPVLVSLQWFRMDGVAWMRWVETYKVPVKTHLGLFCLFRFWTFTENKIIISISSFHGISTRPFNDIYIITYSCVLQIRDKYSFCWCLGLCYLCSLYVPTCVANMSRGPLPRQQSWLDQLWHNVGRTVQTLD